MVNYTQNSATAAQTNAASEYVKTGLANGTLTSAGLPIDVTTTLALYTTSAADIARVSYVLVTLLAALLAWVQ